MNNIFTKLCQPTVKKLISFLTQNWMEKLLALVFAMLIWWINYNKQPLVTVVKPASVLYNGLGNDRSLGSELLHQVWVTLELNQQEVKNLPELQVMVNLKQLPLGKTWVPFQATDLLGAKSKVLSFDPKQIEVNIEPLAQQWLPIRVEFSGAPSHLRTNQINISPQTVLLKGPRYVLSKLSFIPTIKMPFNTLNARRRVITSLVIPENTQLEGKNSVTLVYTP